jgi:hypothetical protein
VVDPLTLGLVLALLGMGGTLLALFILSLLADLLKRLFPEGERGPGSGAGETKAPPPANSQPATPNPSQAPGSQ